MRRLVAVLGALLMTSLLTTGCGGDDSGDDTSSIKTIEITFVGDTVTPSGDTAEVKVGEQIRLVVKADRAGEIHVHSSPEQEKEYGVGTTEIELDPITVPGQVVVESHALDKVIVTLQVQP